MSKPKRSVHDTEIALREVLASHVPQVAVDRVVVDRGDLVAFVAPELILHVLKACKEHPRLDFGVLLDVTAVDWMDARPERFEVIYQLLSVSTTSRLTIKVPVPEDSATLPSATSLWHSSNFMEREVWDMFGVRFNGHPDLRRILMYEEFVGHPLRKDYPVQGKQPRIPLRAAEVENTARLMQRPDLVAIRPRRRPVAEQDQQGA